jgi:hypothetical protein
MNSSKPRTMLAAAALLASTGLAAAQGTSGGTGAVASIPGSVVRGHEQGYGLFSILTDPNPGQPVVVRQPPAPRRENPQPK